MKIIETSIPDVKVLEPKRFGDERGFFMEIFREQWFREHVADVGFVQDNHSKSKQGILRGLHYQLEQPQGKLVRVTFGEVFDVAVDLREDSATFGQWYGTHLSAGNYRQMWVPAGFAHGFLVLSGEAEFLYKCTDYYHPDSEQTLLWNDPTLAINWPIDGIAQVILSEKDRYGATWMEAKKFKPTGSPLSRG
ncbi:dTDP-4-dehydrorhamnose 3,5-epimerase [Marinimicrobium sp. ABcell2]|uniref:dTDP-4-dehydrorhamnose 3,5-epimerase n=1 Tax=Marinimicrobium sp. ABcell2 TaxID=3069751 RepID=UPI0027B1043A|nr:dTDP-4-dehydrorhamnose 3,5-epimerase [Marinimicrobium sp. ABcell2]MDQ2078340.1 dTDP-4-dehydrorhamnose 3,5-epimerase [Marinimicrobium sp. ABcell2]